MISFSYVQNSYSKVDKCVSSLINRYLEAAQNYLFASLSTKESFLRVTPCERQLCTCTMALVGLLVGGAVWVIIIRYEVDFYGYNFMPTQMETDLRAR